MTAIARRWLIVLAGLTLGLAAAATSLGPVRSFAATSFTVTSATDLTAANPTCTNPCSLRQAIVDANATTGAVVVTFTVPGPFNLTNGELTINGSETSLDVQGAADGGTVIHQNGTDRVLLIETSGISVTLSDVTLTGGHALTASGTGDDGYGGAIDINTGASVMVINSTITGNSAQVGGGAIDDNTTSGADPGRHHRERQHCCRRGRWRRRQHGGDADGDQQHHRGQHSRHRRRWKRSPPSPRQRSPW